MRATLLIACLAGFVSTVSAYGVVSDFGAYAGGRLIPMTFLPSTGSSFATFEKCTDDSDWPTAGGTFNSSAGLEGCKTQCVDAYTQVGQAMYVPVLTGGGGKCCCQAITMAQRSAASCIQKADDDQMSSDTVQSYLYKEYLPGICDPWYDFCKNSGGGWSQSCLQALLTAPEYSQGAPDTVGLEVSWEFQLDTDGTSCSSTTNLVQGTEGSCTQHTLTYDEDDGTTTSLNLYSTGYCDSLTDRGTFASFITEAECLAYAAADYVNYNYSFSVDAVIMLSGLESATCETDANDSSSGSFRMTCSNWCTDDSNGDSWCQQWADAVNKAGKALGTMLLIIIISIVVVVILGVIGCWYCCCRNKGEQTVIVQGGQAGVPMAAPVTQAQPPGAVYMKNGVWLDKNDQPVAAQQV